MRLAAAIFICLMLPALAEKPWPASVAEPQFILIAIHELPQGLQNALLNYADVEQVNGDLPDKLSVCRVKLKRDGPYDYIVEVPQDFSGGPEMGIFEPHDGKFVEICSLQTIQYFGPRVNGFYQLICQSRGGAGAELRELLQFKNGRYHTVRMTDYQMQEFGGEMKFVRERDPKEFSDE